MRSIVFVRYPVVPFQSIPKIRHLEVTIDFIFLPTTAIQ
jgi:hypothetical protein